MRPDFYRDSALGIVGTLGAFGLAEVEQLAAIAAGLATAAFMTVQTLRACFRKEPSSKPKRHP